ncbi:hypothetical protein VPNG_05549 [Cytospora leucostoma]|uniref:Clr5 domain-containing protein n=1 Tax=Cytospora leucostoma TaxID=1230097 RepID=A0A423X733_9PEZI|nr:hypothetical protein VPNG_05549 [Cytospora leucostoma]
MPPRGRPRADFDRHKDLIIQLYQDKTPWTRIEEILLTQHGCKAKSRTILDRFKEWDTELNRVRTDITDALKDQIRSYWADRDNRPKTDEELHQKLVADGFTISPTAVPRLRNELKLFRRWDHKLGRVRPESELDKRKRNWRKKRSAYTDVQLAPPNQGDGGNVQPQLPQPEPPQPQHPQPPQDPQRPQLQITQPESNVGTVPRAPRPRRQARQAQPAQSAQPTQSTQPNQAAQPAQTSHTTPHLTQQPFVPVADQSSAMKDAQIKNLQDRVRLLQNHCLAHGIGLPPPDADPGLLGPGLESLSATVDMGHWHAVPGYPL